MNTSSTIVVFIFRIYKVENSYVFMLKYIDRNTLPYPNYEIFKLYIRIINSRETSFPSVTGDLHNWCSDNLVFHGG